MTARLGTHWSEATGEILAMISNVSAAFEASDLKHQLTRAGFMPPGHWHATPFAPDAFYGELVLTSGESPSEFRGPAVDDAACIFFSGVVNRPLFHGLVRPERDGRAELQVGLVLMERRARIAPVSAAWTMTRAPRGAHGMLTIASRKELGRLIDESDNDPARLIDNRNDFFLGRWRELSSSRLADRWLRT